MTQITKIWRNAENGHHFAIGPSGMSLNGKPVSCAPEWSIGRPADEEYGPIIEWAGGECPVSPSTDVRCIFRGRRPYVGKAIWDGLPNNAQKVMWHHAPAPGRSNPASDIVAYQVRVS